MALHSHYAVTVSAAVATRSRADCSSMEVRRGNKRPYQPKHSPSIDGLNDTPLYYVLHELRNNYRPCAILKRETRASAYN